MAKMKPLPRLFLIGMVVGGASYGVHRYLNYGSVAESVDLKGVSGKLGEGFSEASPATPASGAAAKVASNEAAALQGQPIKILTIPWNGTFGLQYAVGGKVTKKGSIAEELGLNLVIERQDDYSKMQADIVTCAGELKGGADRCVNGALFTTIMGDGAPAFMDGLNKQLAEKVGAQYVAEIIGGIGRSAGEDSCMIAGTTADEAKKNLKGSVIAGVPKDGDQNICIDFAKRNDVRFNPDPTTFDPEAVNWVGTSSFVEAGEKYIAGYCEDRKEVKNGAKTGKTVKACVNGVATWTPGDVTVATKKGGLYPVWSTRENSSQMATTLIGIKKWNASNRDLVVSLLRAAYTGGDALKGKNGKVMMRAGAASAEVYGEEDAAYWVKYYNGVTEMDAQGNMVPLGGSRAWNLADASRYFGLDGGINYYAATYTLFGDYQKAIYPADLPNYPPVASVLNVSYMKQLTTVMGEAKGVAEVPTFEANPSAPSVTLANKDWHINFATGSAAFAADAAAPLAELLNQLAVSDNVRVEIHGHTDNTGTPEGNRVLSKNRAEAVKKHLLAKAGGSFPADRFAVIAHGQDDPKASNASADGRAENRRVTIVLKSN